MASNIEGGEQVLQKVDSIEDPHENLQRDP